MTDGMTAEGDDRRRIRLTVNGVEREGETDVRTTLSDFLRRQLKLTGTHLGCEHGVCGACTVLLDGSSVRACLLLAVQADGASLTTVEGLAERDGTPGILQESFKEFHGLQCGFCTPGILTTLTELLRETPEPNEEDVREALSGNICRCTGYQDIVAATMNAAARLRGEVRS